MVTTSCSNPSRHCGNVQPTFSWRPPRHGGNWMNAFDLDSSAETKIDCSSLTIHTTRLQVA
jgi:hypothetical protein